MYHVKATKSNVEEIDSLFFKNKYDEVIQYCDKQLRTDPENPFFFTKKGEALLRIKKYDEAIKCFDEAMLTIPYPEACLWKTRAFRIQGNFSDALEWFDDVFFKMCFERASKDEKDNIIKEKGMVFGVAGTKLFQERKYDEAIKYLNQSLEINPNDIGALDCKGNIYGVTGKYQEAKEYFEKILKIDPNNELVKEKLVKTINELKKGQSYKPRP
jgi:tetratricopeptide (TPR) repeat protein